jgi:translocation and assembly module TamB
MRRAVGVVLRTLATAVVFAVALGAGAILHVDLPVARRLMIERINHVLLSSLVGRIRIESVGGVGLTRVVGLDVRVDDRAGHELLRLDGVRVRFSAVALTQALFARGDLTIDLPETAVAYADVNLDADDDGTLRIARAFTTPRPTSPAGPSRGVRLKLAHVRVGRTSIHGQMNGAPPIDSHVDDLEGSLVVSPGSLEIHADHLNLAFRNLPGGAEARGAIEAHLAQPSPRGGDRALRVSWQGTVGPIAETARLTYDAGEIDTVVDVPDAKPDDLRLLWPKSPIIETISVHADAHGTLRELQVHARASAGGSALEINGPVTIADEVNANLHATAQSFDAHAVAASAPSTRVDASADVHLVTTTTRAVKGNVDLEFAGGSVASMIAPPATAHGEFAYDPVAPERTTLSATIAVHEPGLPIDLTLRLMPKKGSSELTFNATARTSLEALSRFRRGMQGSVKARVAGTLDTGNGRLDARVDADASEVLVTGIRLDTARLTAHATGNLSSPSIDAELTGSQLDVRGLHFASVHAEAHGPPAHVPVALALLGEQGDVDAHADLSIDQGATLRNAVASIRAGGERVVARSPLIRLSTAEARVDDLEVEGLGEPLRAAVGDTAGELSVKAQSAGLDLGRLAHFGHVDAIAGGRLAFDVDAKVRKDGLRGYAKIDLSDVAFGGWTDGGAHLDARFDEHRVSGRFAANIGDVGELKVQSSSIEIGGAGPLEWSSWKRAWGAMDATVHVDLARLASQLGELPFEDLGGTVDAKVRLERDSVTDDTPELDVTASTTRFVASSKRPPQPWRVEGVDATAHAHIDGKTGQTSFDAQAVDASGPLVSLTAKSGSVPYARIFETDAHLFDVLRTMPFQARIAIPERELDGLPPVIRTKATHGRIATTLDWNGTVLEPKVEINATVRNGRSDVSVLSLPIDLDLAAHYDGPHGDATLRASSRNRNLLDAKAHVDTTAVGLLEHLRGAPLAWTASLEAHLSRFPLQTVGAFDVRQIAGHASGDITIDRLHDDASGKLDLTIDDLRVGDVACRRAHVQASVDAHALDAVARVEEEDGFVEARARAGTRWGAAIMPSIDASQPSEVSVTAEELRAELLLPFASGVFSELDGRLTGAVRVQIDPVAKTIHPQGIIALKNGTFELAKLGGEFHEASAKIVLTPDGVVKLEEANARGLSGRVQMAATARFDGLAFGAARAVVQIPAKTAMPLVFDGVQVGILDGRFDVAADRAADHRGIDVTVDVPTMHVQLPTAANHDVQPLGGIDGVDVGRHRGPSEFVPAPLDTATDALPEAGSADRVPVKITVRLGGDVEVQRGTDLDMRLEGAPSVILGSGEARATGQIRLARGTLDVEGKRFDIQGDSTVTFVGDDATNPQVVLTAGWVAPDGTNVFADFIGPLKTGKVTLRSQPSRSQSEILALILFGTTDEQAPAGAASPQATGAVGLAGGAATAPINRALGGVNHMLDNFGLAGGLSTKIDTSTTSPRPEVELQIARDISLQVAWVLGVPPPGSNPDSTLLTLNWRFLRQWSLVTTVGDAGTSIVDLIWQQRY